MTDDGGPEFPEPDDAYLRDYFAAAALQGLVTSSSSEFRAAHLAKMAYIYADAMLEERDK